MLGSVRGAARKGRPYRDLDIRLAQGQFRFDDHAQHARRSRRRVLRRPAPSEGGVCRAV